MNASSIYISSHLDISKYFFPKVSKRFFFFGFFFFFSIFTFSNFFLFVFHSFLGKTARSHGPRAARVDKRRYFPAGDGGGEYVKKKCPNRGKENGK